ncbi:MAG: hypothetical protein Ct9H90mP22_6830 [Gammaproteobacteria bacterium]|nr:MAG: hypothetical protein Ct9H90mP22_6830 [Gammaproteobacteria bacterium]
MAKVGHYLLQKKKEINQKLVPCHKDIYGPNFILLDGDMYLIDWEYSGMESKFFDFGDLCYNKILKKMKEKNYFLH